MLKISHSTSTHTRSSMFLSFFIILKAKCIDMKNLFQWRKIAVANLVDQFVVFSSVCAVVHLVAMRNLQINCIDTVQYVLEVWPFECNHQSLSSTHTFNHSLTHPFSPSFFLSLLNKFKILSPKLRLHYNHSPQPLIL